jgi:serine/threonine protein phosphatase 1
MFGFRRKDPNASSPPFQPNTPYGVLVYVVGDIHGRADLLSRLVEMMRADSVEQAEEYRPILVLLGDYVDRGPASNQVISDIIGLQSDPWFKVFALRGNHDQIFLDFLQRPELGPTWANYGGGATMLSYGITPPRQTDAAGWAQAAAELAAAVPAAHVDFLSTCLFYTTIGDYIFVHAGVKPKVALEDQDTSDLIAIRRQFLTVSEPAPGKVVVFGHTPFEAPLVEAHKIGVDTGACVTGVLTALAIKNGERRFLQTGAPDRIWPVPEPISGKGDVPRRL